jgi:Conserved TM helix.
MYGRNPEQLYLQDQAMEWLPRILGAVAIFIVAYILARAAKWAIAKIVDKVPALRRHNEGQPAQTVGSLIGDIAFWLILLVGILLALQPLGLSQVLEPVRELTTNTFAFIPNIIAAGLIFFIGLVIAKIVRRITEGALLAANADAWLRKTGLIEGNGVVATEAPAEAQPEVPAPREAAEQEPGQEAQREAELDAGPEARPGTEQEAGSEAEREPRPTPTRCAARLRPRRCRSPN